MFDEQSITGSKYMFLENSYEEEVHIETNNGRLLIGKRAIEFGNLKNDY